MNAALAKNPSQTAKEVGGAGFVKKKQLKCALGEWVNSLSYPINRDMYGLWAFDEELLFVH